MGDNNFGSVVDSLLKGMNSILATKTVVGEATKVDDTVILPLVDVSFGVGEAPATQTRKTVEQADFVQKCRQVPYW